MPVNTYFFFSSLSLAACSHLTCKDLTCVYIYLYAPCLRCTVLPLIRLFLAYINSVLRAWIFTRVHSVMKAQLVSHFTFCEQQDKLPYDVTLVARRVAVSAFMSPNGASRRWPRFASGTNGLPEIREVSAASAYMGVAHFHARKGKFD